MWDTVYEWLLALVATLDGLAEHTYDGEPVTGEQLLGYAALGDSDLVGSYDQQPDAIDTLTAEAGEVVVRFVSRSGDDDLAPHRATTRAWVDGLRDAIAADVKLGALLPGSTTSLGHVEVQQQKTTGGVRVERAVTVRYETRF